MLSAHLVTTPTADLRRSPQIPADRDLPDAAALLAGARPVARFLEERGVDPHQVEPAQAHYRPGRSLAICFRTAGVERSSGRPTNLTVTLERRAGEAAAIWAFPADPSLPGLAPAADGPFVRHRLRPRPAAVFVAPVRYRPRRRAVLRYGLPDGRILFGKVMPPKRARRLLALAAALAEHPGDPAEPFGEPGADPFGEPDAEPGLRLALPLGQIAPGALLLPPLPGSSLRDLLLAGGPLPAPERLATLPEALHRRCSAPGWPVAPGDRAGPTRRTVDAVTALCAAQVVARLLPDQACRAGRLAEAVIGWCEASEQPPEAVVHGDLYESQVVVDGGTLGLIDLDDLGPGDPLLDGANFGAHLLLLGTCGSSAGGLILRYRDELRRAFCRRFDADPADLAWREAYCLLRLAAGPFRVLHPEWPRRMAARLALADEALAGR